MELEVLRTERKTDTPGVFLVDGKSFGYTIEDQVRAEGVYVKTLTAIPYGRYEVHLRYSPKFKRITPHIVNIAGESIKFGGTLIDLCYILIHGGNKSADTEGCLCLGAKVDANGLPYDCHDINEKLVEMIKDELDSDRKVFIEYKKAA